MPRPTERTGGKNVVEKSVRRLIAVRRIPLAIVIDSANCHDMKLARPTLESLKVERPSLLAVWPQGLCLDKGYDYPQIQPLAVELGYRLHIRSRGKEAQHRKTG